MLVPASSACDVLNEQIWNYDTLKHHRNIGSRYVSAGWSSGSLTRHGSAVVPHWCLPRYQDQLIPVTEMRIKGYEEPECMTSEFPLNSLTLEVSCARIQVAGLCWQAIALSYLHHRDVQGDRRWGWPWRPRLRYCTPAVRPGSHCSGASLQDHSSMCNNAYAAVTSTEDIRSALAFKALQTPPSC